jgi:murein DD-endopeptidase MepM/ murein hydrolase activator NlpD
MITQKRGWQILVMIFIFGGFILMAFRANVYGQTINELRKQRDTIAREIERKKKEADKKRQEAEKLAQQIKEIDVDIGYTEDKIQETDGQIENQIQLIAQLTESIQAEEVKLKEAESNQDETIRTVYETTDQNPLILIMGSQGLSEAVDRAAYLEALELKIQATILEIQKIKSNLEQQRQAEQDHQKSLEQLKHQQEIYRGSLVSQKKYRSNLLVNTKKTQEELERQIEEAKKAYSDVNSELYRLQEAARTRGRTDGPKKVGSLNVGWPIQGQITTHFGEPTRVQKFHTGIDLDCQIGDKIISVADGKVSFVGGDVSYGYGLYIIIDHGTGISSLYGHLSGFEVKVGDGVKLGQLIGYCGNTGYAYAFLPGGDGSHLHGEIREEGVPVNPLIYYP